MYVQMYVFLYKLGTFTNNIYFNHVKEFTYIIDNKRDTGSLLIRECVYQIDCIRNAKFIRHDLF